MSVLSRIPNICSKLTPLEGGWGTHTVNCRYGPQMGFAQLERYAARSFNVMVPGKGGSCVTFTISAAMLPSYRARGPSSAMRPSVLAYAGFLNVSPAFSGSPLGCENNARISVV